MELIKLSEDIYNEFAKKHPYANFLNSIYSGRKFEDKGWVCTYLGFMEKDAIIAATLLVSSTLHNSQYFYAPRGFLIDYSNKILVEEFVSKLKIYLKEQNAMYLKIDPYVPYQERDCDGKIIEESFKNENMIENLKTCGFLHQGLTRGYDENVQCRWMSIIHLDGKSEEDIMNAMPAPRKRNLKASLKSYIHVRPLKKEELYILVEMTTASGERQGFSSSSLAFYEEGFDYYGEHACAYVAYLDIDEYLETIKKDIKEAEDIMEGVRANLEANPTSKKMRKRIEMSEKELERLHTTLEEANEIKNKYPKKVHLSASYFFKYGSEIIYLAGGSKDEFMHFKGSYAVQWHMIKMAIQEGYSIYNFYGISGYFEKGEEGYGVFDFKRGFNADVVELLGDFILPINKVKYKIYHSLRGMKEKIKK